MKTFITLLVAIFLNIVPTKAQAPAPGNGSVKGIVIDNKTKHPIEYANVILYNAADSALLTGMITDANGQFHLKKIPEGRYYLVLQFVGYSTKTLPDLNISSKSPEANLGTIGMESSANSLNEVEITGTLKNIEYKIDKKVVDVSKAPVDAGATAAEALRNVPGVNVDADGNVTIRGSAEYVVLVDGKPTTISGNDLLKQIPASTIHKIELITNPSAKYEAEGTAGIINIILKKGITGFNGIVNVSAGTGDKYIGNFMLNYKKNKSSFYLGSYYWDRRSTQDYFWRSKTINQTDSNIVNFDLLKKDHSKGINLKSGFDYAFNKKNNFSISGEAGEMNHISNLYYQQFRLISSENINRYTINTAGIESPWRYYYFNTNYKHVFNKEGHELLLNTYFSDGNGNSKYFNREQLSNNSYQELLYFYDNIQVKQNSTDRELQSKMDYTLPIDSTQKIESGLLYKTRPKNSSLYADQWDSINNSWIKNKEFLNRYQFNQSIYAAYITYSKSWKKFEFQLGLRSEYTDRILEVKPNEQQYTYSRIDLFPSASIVRNMGKNGQLQLNYSRRIDRPDEGSLNPFPEFSTNSILVVGNPNLKPEYIESYQINYMLGPLAVETYFRVINNAINGDNIKAGDNGALSITPINISKKITYGTDLSGGLPIQKWGLIQFKFSGYFYSLQGENVASNIPKQASTYETFLSFRANMKKIATFETYGGYSTPTYLSQGKTDKYYYAGANISKSFMNKALTAKMSIRNPFNIMKFEINNNDGDTQSNVKSQREANVVTFSLTYKINNYKPSNNNLNRPGNIDGGSRF